MISDRLKKIVGAGNVSTAPALLDAYARDISFVNTVRPHCVARPRNAGDIAKIVRLANETGTPLVPVSSGPPHFRGDTVPALGGSVIVDMSGLKKIIHVDRMNRVAMFEPGVTYGELAAAAAGEGLRLNLPLAPRRSKAVLGHLLEREPVIMPRYHWDIGDPLACVEIVFGNGETFRTGAAAGPGSIEEQWAAGGAQKEAAGPSAASWYRLIQGSQGTMGIVTWASVRCELIPTLEVPFMAGAPDLAKITEMVHWLLRLRLVNECFILNDSNLASVMARRPKDYRAIKDSLPRWVLFFNIAGYEYLPEKRVAASVRDMKSLAQRVGLEPVEAIGRVAASDLLNTVRQPSREPYWKLRRQGACQDIFFLTIYDRLPALLEVMDAAAAAAGYPAPDLGVYIQPIVQGTNLHVEFNLPYDPADPAGVEKVKKLTAAAVKDLAAAGAFFSRPYGETAGMIINRDAATVAALKKVKSITDPNYVMNPGKLCF
ncbi:MAG TPA: FAD-binding oxidoreductase [Dehalococcoidales bacterium]|nr:FAD-binding oxidoreductase [Dehalococcoidales bacterium]